MSASVYAAFGRISHVFYVKVVDVPFVPQRQIPMVLLFSRPQRFPSCSTFVRWSMLLLCMSCLTCPLLCHTGALVQHRRKQCRFRLCSSSTRIRTCPSWCDDGRWSRRADNCGVAAVAVQRGARGDSKVQFMDTVVFMRTARGDATGAVLLFLGPWAPVMRTGAGWRRRPGVVSRGVWHPLINCMRAA